MSIRDRVHKIAVEMLGNKPSPAQLSEFEISLAGLLSHINEELCYAEIEFRGAILAAESKTAAGKRVIAEAGPSFKRLLEAKATQASCDQMLKTCRSAIRLKTEEMRLQR